MGVNCLATMKFLTGTVVIALTASGFALAQDPPFDWTCESCESDLTTFYNHSKSPRGIAFEEPYLYREVCTRPEFHTNECDKAVSDWWPRIADILYNHPVQYTCDRLTGRNCSNPNQPQQPQEKLRDLSTCDECLRLMARGASVYDHP